MASKPHSSSVLFITSSADVGPTQRVAQPLTLTAVQPFLARLLRKLDTTGDSSRPITNGTGHNNFLPWPNPGDSTRHDGVATGGTRTVILQGFLQSLLVKDSSRSSESLPRAEIVKMVLTFGASGDVWIFVKGLKPL
ncbi:hypothetical protein ACH5RR_012011 [Cinchona calisaya]|uniref:Uncharacterized protein n=1 Tax=Cinchona calisaya TaxID=153742 RepID=A0ABD3AA50_9GENT